SHLLHHLLDIAARSRPDSEAVVDGGRRFSYREFAARVERFAATVHACGLKRRDRIAIFLDKSFEEVCAIFGASRAGGVFVPVNALLRPKQVLHILDDCRVRFLVTSARRFEMLSSILPNASSVERILLVDNGEHARHDGPTLVPAFAGTAATAPPPATIAEDLAAILYTSGSTGPPKGVMVSHRSLLAGSRIVCEYLKVRHDERILSAPPFSCDYGLNQLITAVDRGATTILLTFRFGDEIVRTIHAEHVTALAGVPTLWTVLIQGTPRFRREALATLRYMTNSGG